MASDEVQAGGEEPGPGQGRIELGVGVGAIRGLLQQRQEPGMVGEELLEPLLLGRRQRPGRIADPGIPLLQLLPDGLLVVGRAAEEGVGVLLGRDRRAGEVLDRQRLARLAQGGEPILEPIPGAPDEEDVEQQQDDDRGGRDDPGPSEDRLEAAHRRVSGSGTAAGRRRPSTARTPVFSAPTIASSRGVPIPVERGIDGLDHPAGSGRPPRNVLIAARLLRRPLDDVVVADVEDVDVCAARRATRGAARGAG